MEIVMREHGTLRAARGARRVKDCRKIISVARDRGKCGRCLSGGVHQFAMTCRVERQDPCTDLRGQRIHARLCGGIADDERGLRVTDEIFELSQGIGGVQRQIDRPGTQCGEIDHQSWNRFLHLHSDAVARHHALRDEHIGKTSGEIEQVAIGIDSPVHILDRLAGDVLRGADKAVEQILTHDWSLVCARRTQDEVRLEGRDRGAEQRSMTAPIIKATKGSVP